ncbi:MAG: AAA family ATPase [Thermoleophilia bacterium]
MTELSHTPQLDRLLSKFDGVKRSGVGYLARCPAHEDRTPSLSISEGDDGRILVHCHAGCTTEAVVAAVGLSLADLAAGNGSSATGNGRLGELVATYRYVDDDNKLLYEVCRYEPKTFRQRRPDGVGGWQWNLNGARRVLYHLPALIAAVKSNQPIYICEGEKDVVALERAGAVATCNAGGAGKWRAEYNTYFAHAQVIIVADNDEPGRKHAAQIATSLHLVAASVSVVHAAAGKDASDHLAAGHTLAEFVRVEAANATTLLPIYSVAELLQMNIPKPQYIVALPLGLARGTVAELDAYPKHGKTRLTLDAIWSVLHGLPFLAAPTSKVKVLYLTEEWLITWHQALAEAQLLDEPDSGLSWMSLIEAQAKGPSDWGELCEALRQYCITNGIGLLVVDTLARWAGVSDENDAVAMAAAVLPLRLIASENIAVLFLRHDRKGGGVLGESGRGSSSATGEADCILHLQRKAGQGEFTLRQRELEGVSRLAGMTGKLIIELNASGHFDLVGSRGDVVLQRAKEHVLGVLPARKEDAWTVKELAAGCPGSESTLTRILEELVRQEEIGAQAQAGHAAQSKSKKAIGYWRLTAACQEGCDLDEQ